MVQGPVLIVGCGVFGLSTALELVKKNKYVILLDKYQPPSFWSAANDFNKIIRCEYSDPTYARLAVEAIDVWRADPLFSKSYVECGRILATPMRHKGRGDFESKGIEHMQNLGEGLDYEYFTGGDSIKDKFPCFQENTIPMDQKIKYNPNCGLGVSSDTLENVYQYLKSHKNVKFHFGDKGCVTGLKKYKNGEAGIITKAGYIHTAPTVILATGANTGSILDLENQQSATGLFVTHIQLDEAEFEKYSQMPVVFDAEIGYFFPPDAKTKIMKLCVTGRGVKRITDDPHSPNSMLSLPRYHNQYPKDTIPTDLIPVFKQLLLKYTPDLATHRLFGSKICWIGDRDGSHFLIDKVPRYKNLYVATGDSGHGYKFFPIIGKYIIKSLDNELEDELKGFWMWESRVGDSMVDPSKSAWKVVKQTIRDLSECEFTIESESSKL